MYQMYCVSSCLFFERMSFWEGPSKRFLHIIIHRQIFSTGFVLKTCGSIDNYRSVATIFANNSPECKILWEFQLIADGPNAKSAEFPQNGGSPFSKGGKRTSRSFHRESGNWLQLVWDRVVDRRGSLFGGGGGGGGVVLTECVHVDERDTRIGPVLSGN